MKATINTTETAPNHQKMGQLNAEILQWISAKIERAKSENQLTEKYRPVELVQNV